MLETRGIYLSGDVANQGRAGTYAPVTGARVAARMAETLQLEGVNMLQPKGYKKKEEGKRQEK